MSDEITKQAVEVITSRSSPGFFTKTQNQRLAHVDDQLLDTSKINECFFPLDDDGRAKAKLLAGEKGQIKEVPEHNFIFVKTDPTLLQKLQEQGKLDGEQPEVTTARTMTPSAAGG